MERKKRPAFPKGFFSQPRPHLTTKETIKGNKPFNWSEEALSGKAKVRIISANKKTLS